MPNDQELYKAIASVNYIRDNLKEGVSTNQEVIGYLKAETFFLLLLIQNWQDQRCVNQKHENWLKDYGTTYDLSGYSSFDITIFKLHKQFEFQQYLDSLPSNLYPRYQIVNFELAEQTSEKDHYAPIVYLCPEPSFNPPGRGGPNGSVNPPSPSPPR